MNDPFELTKKLQRFLEERLNGNSIRPILAQLNDRLFVVVDSSESNEHFTVAVFVTLSSDCMSWYKQVFLPWDRARQFPGQHLSYKETRNSNSALKEMNSFLSIVDKCPGRLLTITFPPTSEVCLTNEGDTKADAGLLEYRMWSDKKFERLNRTCCAMSVAMNTISSHPKRWIYFHDWDELFEGDFRESANMYLNCFINGLRDEEDPVWTPLVTKDQLENKLAAKALLAIPDFVAGGMASAIDIFRQEDPSGNIQSENPNMKPKDKHVGLWMAKSGPALTKMTLEVNASKSEITYHWFTVGFEHG